MGTFDPRFRALLAGARNRSARATEDESQPPVSPAPIVPGRVFFTQGRRD